MLHFHNASVEPLWSELNLHLMPGEFLAVLGPNGVGKSTLLRAILGQQRLSAGTVEARGRIGYIPQQRMFPRDLPIRVRDLVSLSLAHGVLRGRRPERSAVDDALRAVGAESIATQPVGKLSGGQQQLVRQAQAAAVNPELLLADEPLLSLDIARQHDTIARMRTLCDKGGSVVFVTHSINPIIDAVDRILYLAPHGHTLGTVDEVMRPDVLSTLYGTPVNVVRVGKKMVVM